MATVNLLTYEWDKRKKEREAMKKQKDELRPEYDLTQLKGCVRGKYAARSQIGTNIILLAPDPPAGTWCKEDEDAFLVATRPLEIVDEEIWK